MSDSHPSFLPRMQYSHDAWNYVAKYASFVQSRRKPMGTFSADLHHMGTGAATEAGEILSTTKKMWVYGQTLDTVNKEGKTNEQNLLEEIGDTLFYLQGLCNLLNVNMCDVMYENVKKLEKRYPSGYSDAAALERADKIVAVKPSGESPLTGLVGKFGE